MANILSPPAPTIPLVTEDGHVTPVWRDWFRNVADVINQGGGLDPGLTGEVEMLGSTLAFKDGILMSRKET